MTDPHPSTADLGYTSATQLVAAFSESRITSEEVVDALIERIAALDAADSPTALRSIAAVSADARAVARERDQERAAG
ncbi:MAG: amidase, partial [Acidobacteriota bacterium]|nr:amidase [Acidobacteriota bacterium]